MINSKNYWDQRFVTDWEANLGPAQSEFFARIVIENLPDWLVRQIKENSYTVVDWGCAEGSGTKVFSEIFDKNSIVGVDFSAEAIDIAKHRYKNQNFLAENWLNDVGGFQYDVLISSNTLEHFENPYKVLEFLTGRAKKAIVLAIPYKEYVRIDEHFYTFDENNIPFGLSDEWMLAWSRVVDCSTLGQYWNGSQIILVYTKYEWLSGLNLHLSDCQIEIEDYSSLKNSEKLLDKIRDSTDTIVQLNKVIVENNSIIKKLADEVIEQDKNAQSLAKEVRRLDAHAQAMALDLVGVKTVQKKMRAILAGFKFFWAQFIK